MNNTARGLLNALLAQYIEIEANDGCEHCTTHEDVLINAAMLVYGYNETEATEWLGEEIADRRAALAV